MRLVQDEIASQKRRHLFTESCKLKLKQVLPDYRTKGLVVKLLPMKMGYCTSIKVPNFELLSLKM